MVLNWDHLRWQGQAGADLFEEFCADLLRCLGFSKVEWRKGHPDEGWDIEAECEVRYPGGTRQETWYVQSKRYAQNAGVPAAKIDTKRIEMLPHKPECLLLITSSYFLPKVKDWAKSSHPFRVELWESRDLDALVLHHPPLLEKYFPELAKYLKDEYVSLLAHTIRSSLQWLYSRISYAEFVVARRPRAPESEIRDAFMALKSVASELVVEMRRAEMASSMERGPIAFNYQRTDLARLIREGVKWFPWTHRKPGVQIDIQGPRRIDVEADKSALQIALLNIMDNSLKYCIPNTVVTIIYGLDKSSGFAEVVVSDHGIGIPADEITRVFDKYYRVWRTDVLPGTGIGLTVAKRVIEEHGGTIELKSCPESTGNAKEQGHWLTECRVRIPTRRGAASAD